MTVIAGLWDDRDDPEGWYMDTSRRAELGADEASKAAFIAAEKEKRSDARMTAFGWVVQPVDDGGMVPALCEASDEEDPS